MYRLQGKRTAKNQFLKSQTSQVGVQEQRTGGGECCTVKQRISGRLFTNDDEEQKKFPSLLIQSGWVLIEGKLVEYQVIS